MDRRLVALIAAALLWVAPVQVQAQDATLPAAKVTAGGQVYFPQGASTKLKLANASACPTGQPDFGFDSNGNAICQAISTSMLPALTGLCSSAAGSGTISCAGLLGANNTWGGSNTFNGALGFGYNTQTIPVNGAGLATWNFSGGGGDVDFWNTYIGASPSFSFKQLLVSGTTKKELMDVGPNAITPHVPLQPDSPLGVAYGGTGNTNIYGSNNTWAGTQTYNNPIAFTGGAQFGGSGVTAGYYSDASNLALRTPSATGNIFFQNNGGAANYGGVGAASGAGGAAGANFPSLALTVSPLGLASGGTNCTAASGTCLDNIGGFSGTGIMQRTGAGAYAFQTLSAYIDANLGSTQGSILYRGASNWTALPAGTAGQCLVTSGTGGAPSWQACGGSGNRVLLNTLTASNSANLQDTTSISSTYKEYDLNCEGLINATGSVALKMLLYQSGAFATANYNGGATQSNTANGTQSSYVGTAQTSYLALTAANIPTGLGAGASFNLHFSNPQVAGSMTVLGYGYVNGLVYQVGATTSSGVPTTGFEILFSSGNITSGACKLYGYN